jgi:hypothetical protein
MGLACRKFNKPHALWSWLGDIQSLVLETCAVCGCWTGAWEGCVIVCEGRWRASDFKGLASLYWIKIGGTFIGVRSIITAIVDYNLLARDRMRISDLLLAFRGNLVSPSSGIRRKVQYSSTTLWEMSSNVSIFLWILKFAVKNVSTRYSVRAIWVTLSHPLSKRFIWLTIFNELSHCLNVMMVWKNNLE